MARPVQPPMIDAHEPTNAESHVAGEIRVQNWRRVWVARSIYNMLCYPDPRLGHRLDDPLVWEHGCLRCGHVFPGGGVCNRLVYIVGGSLVTPRGEPLVLLAEVKPAEVREMARARMDYDAAMRFLGIRFPS